VGYLRYFLKVPEDVQTATKTIRLFHARGPATAKAWSLIVVRGVVGTTRAEEDVDRRRRGEEVTATDWMASSSMAPYREDGCIQERTRPPGTESLSPAVFEILYAISVFGSRV